MKVIHILSILSTSSSCSLFNANKHCNTCRHCIIEQYPKNIFVEKCQLYKNMTDKQLLLANYCKNNKEFCNGLFYNPINDVGKLRSEPTSYI